MPILPKPTSTAEPVFRLNFSKLYKPSYHNKRYFFAIGCSVGYPRRYSARPSSGGTLAGKRKRRKKSAVTTRLEHFLVPKHELVPADEEKKILEKYDVTKEQLPRIRSDDPAIRDLTTVKKGDLIRILRKDDHTENTYYRVVV